MLGDRLSRPSRTRGLKRERRGNLRKGGVASLADAWIETNGLNVLVMVIMSRPSRTRGLKLVGDDGLVRPRRVASLADAWIETRRGSTLDLTRSRVPRGRVD